MDKYQQADYNWLQCMERIGRKETAYFEQDNVGYTNQIIELNCRRGIMVWVYATLKQYKKIVPIESLELEDKKQMARHRYTSVHTRWDATLHSQSTASANM